MYRIRTAEINKDITLSPLISAKGCGLYQSMGVRVKADVTDVVLRAAPPVVGDIALPQKAEDWGLLSVTYRILRDEVVSCEAQIDSPIGDFTRNICRTLQPQFCPGEPSQGGDVLSRIGNHQITPDFPK